MKKIIVFIFILIIVGCTTANYSRTTDGIYKPTDADKVLVFFDPPKKPYETIGIVSGSSNISVGEIINYMKVEAAAAGGNAIILREPSYADGYIGATGTVIIFTKGE